MRKVVPLLAAIALAAPFWASADLLDDPGFEGSGTVGWDTNASSSGFALDLDSTADARNGSESFEISWSSAIPQWQLGEAYQEVDVIANDTFHAEAYAKVATALDNTEAYLETIFYDSIGAEIVGQNLQSLKLSSVVDWTLLENNGVAPADAATAKVRLIVFTSGGESSGGTVYWDDAFAQIPEPVTCVMLGVGLAGLMIARRRRNR